MLYLQKQLTAVLAACLLNGLLIVPAALPMTANSNPVTSGDVVATVTAQKGTVFKRDFTDWTKQSWGDPEPAKLADQLHEGMQIGTGNDSWAEVSWPNVKTRAWANTVFAVAPSKRLVYLTGGEMLFRLDKHRKDKDQPYYIWTKVLQARIRGTTVLVQAKGAVTRFSVLEGTVDVYNRLDHSLVTVKPGVVYEVKGYDFNKSGSLPQINGNSVPGTKGGASSDAGSYRPQPMSPPKAFDPNVIPEITYNKDYVPIFQDRYATSNIYVSNKDVLLNHALLQAGSPIDSLLLIQAEQQDLPGKPPLLPINLADSARLNKVIARSTEIKAVPSVCDYFIGQSVGKSIRLPATAFVDLAPKGVVMNPGNMAVQGPNTTTAANVRPPMFALQGVHIMDLPPDKVPAATVFDEECVPAQTQEFQVPATPTASRMPAVIPDTCFSPGQNVGAGAGAFSSTAGMVSPASIPAGVIQQSTGFTAGPVGTIAAPVNMASGTSAGGSAPVFSPVNQVLPASGPSSPINNVLNGLQLNK